MTKEHQTINGHRMNSHFIWRDHERRVEFQTPLDEFCWGRASCLRKIRFRWSRPYFNWVRRTWKNTLHFFESVDWDNSLVSMVWLSHKYSFFIFRRTGLAYLFSGYSPKIRINRLCLMIEPRECGFVIQLCEKQAPNRWPLRSLFFFIAPLTLWSS